MKKIKPNLLQARKYHLPLLCALLLVMAVISGVIATITIKDTGTKSAKEQASARYKAGLKTKELSATLSSTQEELKTDDLKVDNKSDSTKSSETGSSVLTQKKEKNGGSPKPIPAPAPAPAPAPVTVADVNFWSALLNFDPNITDPAAVGCRHSWAVTLSNGQVINHSNTYWYRDYPMGENLIGIVYEEPGYGRFPFPFDNGLRLGIWYSVEGYRC